MFEDVGGSKEGCCMQAFGWGCLRNDAAMDAMFAADLRGGIVELVEGEGWSVEGVEGERVSSVSSCGMVHHSLGMRWVS